MKKKYIKPQYSVKVLKLNFFYTSRSRAEDSINSILGVELLAQGGSCGCGCGSKIKENPV